MESSHVHILDDDPNELLSLAQLVTRLGYSTICHSESDSFLSQFSEQSAGCLILEVKMGEGRGFDVLEAIVKRKIVPPIIVSTRHADVPSVVRVYQTVRPVAFLQRQTTSEFTLLEAIQVAMARDNEQRVEFVRRQELEARLQQLSQPEADVLDLLLRGADHAEIAAELEITRRTVENRRAKIMKKLGACCLPQMVRIVLDAGYRIRP